jgi:sugar O-acyltransferase (sialic acid O-acetyltransferase NeuD family)
LTDAPRRDIAIYGTRGVACEVHQLVVDLAAQGHALACVGFLVDGAYREASSVHGLPVLGDADWLAEHRNVSVVIGIGATAPRFRIAHRIEAAAGSPFPTLRHPRAYLGDSVTIGAGSFVAPAAVATTDVSMGRHVQLHAGCTIGHDTVLGDFVTIAPGARVAGRVVLGEGAFVGIGAVVLPDIEIGRWTVVGAGAVVTRHVPDNVTVAGNPARVIGRQPPGWHRGP